MNGWLAYFVNVGRWSSVAMMAIVWSLIALSFNNPYYAVLVKTNVYGEAFIELILLFILLPWTMTIAYHDIRRDKNETQDNDA